MCEGSFVFTRNVWSSTRGGYRRGFHETSRRCGFHSDLLTPAEGVAARQELWFLVDAKPHPRANYPAG